MAMHPVVDGIQQQIEQSGWNEDSILSIVCDFIQEEGLVDDFEAYAKRRADEENAEVAGRSGRDAEE